MYQILNKPSTNISQMKAWALSKGAKAFAELAEPCYKASLSTGVDPAVSYALSAKETGWCYKNGHSTAGIDASYHNPAGLKITKGGSDFDKNAHKVFKNWEEGYLAQQQHLALYAGKDGYPLANPLDPRHFPYLKGKAKTVRDLGGHGKWNEHDDYGIDVERLMEDLIKTPYTSEQEKRENLNISHEVIWEDLVVYSADADVFAAIILSQKLKCPLIKKENLKVFNVGIKNIHQVGGNPEEKNRFDTFKNVAKKL